MDRFTDESSKPPRRGGAVPPFVPRRTPTPLSSPAVARRSASPFAPPAASNGERQNITNDVVATEEAPVMQSTLTDSVEVAPDPALAMDDALTSRIGEPGSELGIEVYDTLNDMDYASAPDLGHNAVDLGEDLAIAAADASTGEIDRDLASEMASPAMAAAAVAPSSPASNGTESEAAASDQPVVLSWDSEEHATPSVFEFDSYTAFASVDVANAGTEGELDEETRDVIDPSARDAVTAEMTTAADAHEAPEETPPDDIEHEVAAAVLNEPTADELKEEEQVHAHNVTGNPSDGTLEALKEVEPWAMSPAATGTPTAEILLAESLERIAARIRRGELSVPAGMHPETEQASLTVALLAVQLSSGR